MICTLFKFHEILEGESHEKHQRFLDLLGFTESEMKYILGKLQPNEDREDTEIEIVWKLQECYTELEQGFMPEFSV